MRLWKDIFCYSFKNINVMRVYLIFFIVIFDFYNFVMLSYDLVMEKFSLNICLI